MWSSVALWRVAARVKNVVWEWGGMRWSGQPESAVHINTLRLTAAKPPAQGVRVAQQGTLPARDCVLRDTTSGVSLPFGLQC